MKVDVTVPELPESVTEAIIGEWLKEPGEMVDEGEQLVDIETDKVILEITAPQSGELISVNRHKSDQVQSNEVIAVIDTDKKAAKSPAPPPDKAESVAAATPPAPVEQSTETPKTSPAVRKLVAENNIDIKDIQGTGKNGRITRQDVEDYLKNAAPVKTSSAVRKLVAENNIDIEDIQGTGKDGRITRQDVEAYLKDAALESTGKTGSTAETAPQPVTLGGRDDKRVPMTNLRKSIARRLVASQQESATLTTFNEVNMQNVMDIRQRYRQRFEETHGVKLGFMSFFVKASVEALKEFPMVNASIEGDDIVYHGYFDVGVAVSTPRGLVVPVIRNADVLSFADMEKLIGDFAQRARENKITLEELTGGTFTITNGGVFGSMLSTPIINPPQSAILGMHSIQPRPIVQDDEVAIAPVMYLALSYDHRIIDGREAVQFLVHIKDIIENPDRLLLQV